MQPYSVSMISEFEELSQKIDQLAEMTQNLRRENAGYAQRMNEAQRRIEALLENIPALVEAGLAKAQSEEKES